MNEEPNIASINKLFNGLNNSWDNRAAVRNRCVDYTLDYVLDTPDFIERLLPFEDYPAYKNADKDMKSKVLSCGWLIYNEKTVNIETKIISPVCIDIINNKFNSLIASNIRESISQILTDEAYHTLMVVKANELTMKNRMIEPLIFPDFDLINNMSKMKKELDNKGETLLALACAIVSEMSISDYLSKLSKEDGIQNINRIVTYAHWKDEISHASVFKTILKIIQKRFPKKDIELLKQYISLSFSWFESNELNVWESILKQIDFPYYHEMITYCRSKEVDSSNKVYWNYTSIEEVIFKLS